MKSAFTIKYENSFLLTCPYEPSVNSRQNRPGRFVRLWKYGHRPFENNFHLSTCECDKRTWPWFRRSSLALTTFHPLSSFSRQYLMASSAFSKGTGCCSSGSVVDSSSGEPLPLIRVGKAKLSSRNRSKLKSSQVASLYILQTQEKSWVAELSALLVHVKPGTVTVFRTIRPQFCPPFRCQTQTEV